MLITLGDNVIFSCNTYTSGHDSHLGFHFLVPRNPKGTVKVGVRVVAITGLVRAGIWI